MNALGSGVKISPTIPIMCLFLENDFDTINPNILQTFAAHFISIANKDSKEKKQRLVKRRFSVTESLASIQEEMKKENETRMQKMEEMHEEKMQRFDRLLNLYERDLSAER